MKHFFELKFSGHSRYKQTYLWAKFQVEIPTFDLLVYTMLQAKIPVNWLLLRTEDLWALILLGFFIPHQGLPYAQSSNCQAIYQLNRFPRKHFYENCCKRYKAGSVTMVICYRKTGQPNDVIRSFQFRNNSSGLKFSSC